MDTELPPLALARACDDVVADWLRRCVVETARGTTVDHDSLESAIAAMLASAAPPLQAALGELLSRDVEDQRANPLALFRAAVAAPTAVLRAHGVSPRVRDGFHVEAFPDDVYGLSPATWADIDERLVEPGVAWGAWKAITIMRRHRVDPGGVG